MTAYKGIPIVSPHETQKWDEEQKAVNVVIALNNCFDHEGIARDLAALGFTRIICKRNIIQRESDYKVNRVYDMIASYSSEIRLEHLVGQMFEKYCGASEIAPIDYALIDEVDNEVIALIPSELLFVKGQNKHEDKRLAAQLPLISLFEWFEGRSSGAIEPYLEYSLSKRVGVAKTAHDDARRIVSSTYDVFRSLSDALSLDRDFFVRHPVRIQKRARGFEIVDGRHRATFLFVHGFRAIPCVLSKADYQSWLHLRKAREILALSSALYPKALLTPIPHPLFLGHTSLSENTYQTRMDCLARYFADYELRGKALLDVCPGDGYIARNFSFMGMDASALAPGNKNNLDFLTGVNELLRAKVTLQAAWPREARFFVTVLLAPLYAATLEDSWIERAVQLTEHHFIFETRIYTDIERIASKYELPSYEILLRTRYVNDPLAEGYLVGYKKHA
jgi:hypothetical protein